MLGKIFIFALSIALSLLLLEVGVVWFLGEQVKFPRHVVEAPWGLRFNEPNSTYRHSSADLTVWFRINSQGMRSDREYSHAKAPGVLRVASLGDSFAMGYEVEVEDTFASVLERELEAKGYDADVLNFGVSGFGTAEEFLYLEREIWNYDPDLILVSFFVNDPVDNLRTGLFALEGDTLRPLESNYVPAGRIGNFLNTNGVFNWLSERSNSFVILKERANVLIKRALVRKNIENLERVESAAGGSVVGESYPERLALALLESIYASAQQHGVPLIVQSIPVHRGNPRRLIDAFPVDFDRDRQGLAYLPMKQLLDPHLGKEPLYWHRSHWHWTPFSHRLSGQALADLIEREGFFEN